MKSGFVSLIGRPNVGKSTLLNTILNDKISIISSKPGTTRNLIQGIYNEEDTQIVFVDTPGIHKPVNKLGTRLNNQSYFSMHDVDVILFLIDGSEKFGSGDAFIIEALKTLEKPVILVINKIDKMTDDDILLKIDEYRNYFDFIEIVPISAEKNDNVERLISVIKNYLPDNVKYFPNEQKTSATDEFRICEIVREKILRLTNDEVPYSVTCILNSFDKEENIINISVDIIVDRESLKKIIIGKKGVMIKEIGSLAREDLENIFSSKVYLELYVKTLRKWRDKDKLLNELGFENEKM
ncbi:MAG: GTPase Era [Bacilli bacterium]|nr:GTPase Era [Bacilli bacterium]